VSLLWAALIVTVVAAAAIGVMLFVRRNAPEGSYFADGDRASAVFGVLATGFAVLIGFVVFLSFESFDTSRSGAEAEARVATQQIETAQFMPPAYRGRLSGELVCYAREVVNGEWPRMESGSLGEAINPWSAAMFRTIQAIEPTSAAEQTAYDKWFDQVADREAGRADRIHGAAGVIPTPIWIVLFVSAVIIFVFMLLFADSAERAFVQAIMIGGVAVVITSTLLLLWFMDNPYHGGVGGLQPVAMERALTIMDQALSVAGEVTPPCDAAGAARR
jgi:hypothetical protein